MKADRMMGREIAQIRHRIFAIVECLPCSVGIAIDVVGARWGLGEFDWKGKRFGHSCKLTEKGPTAFQLERVKAIQVEIEGWPRDGGQTEVPF